MGPRDLSELIGLIYDSVVDRNACPVMRKRLGDLLGATSGVQFGNYNSKTHVTTMLAPRLSPEELRSFSEYCASISRHTAKHAVGSVIVPEMAIFREDHSRTDLFYRLPNAPGQEATMGTILSADGVVFTVLLVSRPYSKGNFDTSEVELFDILIPHLQRGFQLLRMHLAALGGPPASSVES
jgi:hypothetical protein